MLDALTEQGLKVNTTIDGLNVWLNVGKDCQTAVKDFAYKGWLVRSGNSFDIDKTSQAIRISVPNSDATTAKQFALDTAPLVEN